MPVSYEFSRDEKVTLNEVDEYICKKVGIPIDEKKYIMEFNLITDVFVGALVAEGGSEITCKHMLYLWDKLKQDEGCDEEASDVALLFDVIEEYDFRAWR